MLWGVEDFPYGMYGERAADTAYEKTGVERIMKDKTGRNDPCPCGSGNKFKHCCQDAGQPGGVRRLLFRVPRSVTIVLGVGGFIFLLHLAGTLRSSEPVSASPGITTVLPPSQSTPSQPTSSESASSRPPGPAPPGKVWSEAHGHWHDAPGGSQGSGTSTTPSTQSSSRPPGPAPPGKVWSEAHGHWHDLPSGAGSRAGTASSPSQSSSRPPGPAPPGKVWSEAHGHWHDLPSGSGSGS